MAPWLFRGRPGRVGAVAALDPRHAYSCISYNLVLILIDPTHTRTGWIGQPPILNRHEVVTIDGDVDTLRQATP